VAEELLEPEVLSFRDCERQLLDGFLDFRLEHLLSLGHDGRDVLRAAALKKDWNYFDKVLVYVLYWLNEKINSTEGLLKQV
jgi:hypothetical protein